MNFKQTMCVVLTVGLLSGCAGGLNSMQKHEYKQYEMDQVLIEEKDPGLGAALGILPGGGSFYAREYGYGILNLLLWPASILWDPISGYQGSQSINYDVTAHHLKKEYQREVADLDDKLALKKIESDEYVIAKRKLQEKYHR